MDGECIEQLPGIVISVLHFAKWQIHLEHFWKAGFGGIVAHGKEGAVFLGWNVADHQPGACRAEKTIGWQELVIIALNKLVVVGPILLRVFRSMTAEPASRRV